MVQIITNYTTYDLAYYYADLRRLPRLTDEEQRELLPSTPPLATSLDAQARNRLIEGYLRLATHTALRECPPTQYHRLLPDLIGAVNLALVEVTTRCNLSTITDLEAYLAVTIRGVVKRTIANDTLLKIPYRAREQARQEGMLEQLYAHYRLASLDELMKWFDTDEREEPVVRPISPTEAAPPRDPALRAQVDAWLAYLSPPEQAVIRLRYGLSDDDERAYTVGEIVSALGLTRKRVDSTLKSALLRLKALATGNATITEKDGRQQVTGIYKYKPPVLMPEQETVLMQVATRLREQGMPVTRRALARASGMSISLVQVFLRAHREQFPALTPTDQHQKRLEHVAQVYTQLVAQGAERITSKPLARTAHVRVDTALEFLRAQRSKSHAKA